MNWVVNEMNNDEMTSWWKAQLRKWPSADSFTKSGEEEREKILRPLVIIEEHIYQK